MNYNHIEIKTENDVCRISLNRPEKRNALHAELIAELLEAIRKVAKDPSVKILVLEGNGKSFCAGADLNWFQEMQGQEERMSRTGFEQLGKLLLKLQHVPQPTVALVHGNVLGGGIGLFSVCDFVLIEHSTQLTFSEVLLGVVPAVIMPFVAARISRQQARAKMLTGRSFSAEEALRIGLADELVPDGELDRALQQWLSDFRQPAPGALRTCKKLINQMYSDEIEADDFQYTAKILARRIASDEGREGLTAFREKRKPNWPVT